MKLGELLADGKEGYRIQVDEESKTLIVDTAASRSRIYIDLTNGKVCIESQGDIEVHAAGKLSLRGDAGVEIDSGTDVRMAASEETIIRGKMVRIN